MTGRYFFVFMALALAGCNEGVSPVAKPAEQQQPYSTDNKHVERITTMSQETIREGYIKNATLAQLYRWYQIYENPKVPVNNSLDILDSDVFIKSGLGEAKGHASYRDRVQGLPTTWKNAHDVKSTDITVKPNGDIEMTVNITYQNKGMLPDGAVRTADLTYITALAQTDTVLPNFKSVEIIQNSEGQADNFSPRYVENRIKSLLHYWLAIIEDPQRDPEPVRDILTEDFSLNFSSGDIQTFDGFKAWLAGPGSSVDASTHVISAFEYEIVSDTLFKMQADFEWQGITADGVDLTAKTRHRWDITDNPEERFARIKQVDVEVLIPFHKSQDD